MGLHTAYDNLSNEQCVDVITDMLNGMEYAALMAVNEALKDELKKNKKRELKKRKRIENKKRAKLDEEEKIKE
jgi:hypothetical protein